MTGAGKTGTRVRHDRPPPKPVLGIGAALLAINHLSVVLGNGLMPEALMTGCWLALVGAWVLVAGHTFDVVWTGADRSGRRVVTFVFLSIAAGYGAAEAVARIAYGRPLFG